MLKLLIVASATLISGCASDPALIDPDVFRTKNEFKVSREIAVPADIAASNLAKGGVKCWESGAIRVKQFKEANGYVVTIGVYADMTKSLMIMADITPATSSSSTVTVTYIRAEHKKYAENLAGFADNSVTVCNSPMNRAQ